MKRDNNAGQPGTLVNVMAADSPPIALDLLDAPAPVSPDALERSVDVRKVIGQCCSEATDVLAIEEPLEICVVSGPIEHRTRVTITVTMRTPGHDDELAAGFLFAEGVITDREQFAEFRPCKPASGPGGTRSVIRVDLHPGVPFDESRLERHVATTSACGVCGKTSLDALANPHPIHPAADAPVFAAAVIHTLPERLRQAQPAFERTGGLHAAALFDPHGNLLAVREDVGRHNAVDKLIGAEILAGRIPLSGGLLFVSGRASFELVQKTLAAGLPALAAVGAPSSLAVELARQHGMTLLGFVRDGRFNIYAGAPRIRL